MRLSPGTRVKDSFLSVHITGERGAALASVSHSNDERLQRPTMRAHREHKTKKKERKSDSTRKKKKNSIEVVRESRARLSVFSTSQRKERKTTTTNSHHREGVGCLQTHTVKGNESSSEPHQNLTRAVQSSSASTVSEGRVTFRGVYLQTCVLCTVTSELHESHHSFCL